MFAAPAEGILKDFMEFAETGCADHEQAPPHQRTHATEHYAKLINPNRRYGRFRHASSLPKPTRTPSNLTPRNLPLSHFWLNSNKGTKSDIEITRRGPSLDKFRPWRSPQMQQRRRATARSA